MPEEPAHRVSYTYVKNTDDNSSNYTWDAATLYSYDIHGNVDTLLQDYKTGMGAILCNNNDPSGNRWKKMVYKYDLISGKINEVAYQPGRVDQFYHQYEYDAENRLINVKTSRDRIYWENDATYSYYRHGPLARTVLGELQVQGLDYAYTLQGWLKGVNTTNVGDGSYDMGEDGKTGSVNSLVARDAYGFSLNYFSGDYAQINTAVTAFGTVSNNLPNPSSDNLHAGSDLFNGNIRAMLVNIPKLMNVNLYAYRYDQLNRIVAMNTYNGVSTSNNTLINPSLASQDYNERISYDANGNILGYLRNGASAVQGLAMDSLTYKYDYYTAGNIRKTYIPGGAVPADAARLTNRLNYVKDNGGGTYTEDIKNANINNYRYDKIGNLIYDSTEHISSIEWNVYGKISSIHKTTDNTDIFYTYDPSGNRISKTISKTVGSVTTTKITYYVRDASGNVMSVYEAGENTLNSGDLSQTEVHFYGSSRLGIYNVNTDVQCQSTSQEITTFIRGNKFFELSNHLGNVVVTVSDKKIPHTSNGTNIEYSNADVMTATDYYPFGMEMEGRKFIGTINFRFSINGQEREIELNENITTAKFWEYDGRIGRRWNIDLVVNPWASPYSTFQDNPIAFSDLLGNQPGGGPGKETSTAEKPKVLETVIVKSFIRRVKPVNPVSESTCVGCAQRAAYAKASEPVSEEEQQKKVLKDLNRKALLNQGTIRQASYTFNNDFEKGMIKDNIATSASVAMVAPEIFLYGGTAEVTYGIYTDNSSLIIDGSFNMVSGGALSKLKPPPAFWETLKILGAPILKLADNKLTQHAVQWGLAMKGAALSPQQLQIMRNIATDLYENASILRKGSWGNPADGGYLNAFFYSNGVDVLVTQSDGTMITILKNAMGNKHFNNAATLWTH